MVVLMSLSSWDQVGLQGSPFVQIFSNIGIPAAANILNFVVLVAALSAYNGILYGTSRMLYGLAKEGNAPKNFRFLISYWYSNGRDFSISSYWYNSCNNDILFP